MNRQDRDGTRRLLAATDWAATPLGPPEDWPGPLKAAVAIMVEAATPIGIYWGDDLFLIYNDAWRDLIGQKHPAAFGRAAREVFPEAWEELAPLLEGVMSGRGAVMMEDRFLPLSRGGEVEDAWFSFSMVPILLPDGAPGGIFNFATETTEQVLARRREAEIAAGMRASESRKSFLLSLSDALRPIADPEQIQVVASRILGEHLDADRVTYAEDAGDAEHVTVTRTYARDLPDIAGRYRYRDFGPGLLRELSAGRTVLRPDIANDPLLTDGEKAAHAALELAATLNMPLIKDGRLIALLAVHYRVPHAFTPEEVALVEDVAERTWAAVERARAEARERESRQKYQTLFEAIDEGFYRARVLFDAEGRCVDVFYEDENPAAIQMTGQSFRGRRLSEIGAYEDYWRDIFGHTARTGEGQRLERYAAPDDRWYEFYVFRPPQADPDEVALIFRDVTRQKQSEQQQNMLIAELDHRVKNILAIVQSISRQSLGPSDEAQRLTGRISALAQSHAMLAGNRWEGARFGELVENAVAAYRGENGRRIAVGGPDLKIMPKPAQTLTLALHELVTNAAKYGALSQRQGRVTAAWDVTGTGDQRRLLFRWTERGGPPVAGAPDRRGFGSRLIERTLTYELEGEVSLDFAPEGLSAVFDLPMRKLRVQGAQHLRADPRAAAPPGGDPRRLRGKRILVVEDEDFVAHETAAILEGAGCRVVGPCATLYRALQAVETEAVDAAVLDVNLGGDLVWPVARALRARAVPFVFATGYSRVMQVPPQFGDAPWIEKPLHAERLLPALASLVQGDRSG